MPDLSVIHDGDPFVSMLLGRQKPPADSSSALRPSCFVVYFFAGDGYVLFHTLTRKLIWIAPRLIRFFLPGTYLQEEFETENVAELYDDYFIVCEEVDEYRDYREIRDICRKRTALPGQIDNYILLPVTACNARCFYCYEESAADHPQTMTDDVEKKVIRFIAEHLPKNRTIHIQWFGGEPLCGASRIDTICAALTASGISFTSSMISNGSLFTDALAKKAAREWKMEEVQITLDGTTTEYEKRKRYLPGLPDPFETVIRNIHIVLLAGIHVVIRLNADMDNIGDLYACVDYLRRELSDEEQKKVKVYAHELFFSDDDTDEDRADSLLERVRELNMYAARCFQQAPGKEIEVKNRRDLFTFDPVYCMADPAGRTIVITPEGRLYACEHMPGELTIGDLDSGLDDKRVHAINEEEYDGAAGHCRTCPLLPVCAGFSRCPARTPWPHCRRTKEKILKETLKAYIQEGRSDVSDSGC